MLMKEYIETAKVMKMAREYAEKAAQMRKRGLQSEATVCHTCIGVLVLLLGTAIETPVTDTDKWTDEMTDVINGIFGKGGRPLR